MELLRLSIKPDAYTPNGCGPDGWRGKLIPDTLGGIDISEACNIHDVDYYVGGDNESFEKANMNFLCNMVIIIRRDDTWLTNEGVALKWAMQYYLAVEECGKEYWNSK